MTNGNNMMAGGHVRWEAVHSHAESVLSLMKSCLDKACMSRNLHAYRPLSEGPTPHAFAVTNRRLNHYERRVAALISRETARQLKSLLRRRLAQHTPMLADDFSECLSELASMSGEPANSMVSSKVGQMIASSVRGAIITQLNAPRSLHNQVAARVCESLAEQASLRDAEFRLPPVRNDERTEAPTPVQRRARKAQSGLRTWKRKMALARTKLAAYRRKVNYYKKKGHI